MTDRAPISYPDARDVVTRWAFHISKAGPDVYGMTRQKYAEDLGLLRDVGKLLEAIVVHKGREKEVRS